MWPHIACLPAGGSSPAHGFLQIPVANFIQSKEHVSLAVLERTYVWTHDSGMLSISHADLERVPTWKEGEAAGQDRLGFESCHWPALRLWPVAHHFWTSRLWLGDRSTSDFSQLVWDAKNTGHVAMVVLSPPEMRSDPAHCSSSGARAPRPTLTLHGRAAHT